MEAGGTVGMVLCAGLGTRLRPLTDAVPKPAAPVCGVPLVRWSLALLARAGVRRAVVNVHHLPDAMAAAAGAAGRGLGLDVAVSREPVIAGTGGALREAGALLDGASEVVLVNGDILFDVDVGAAIAAHRGSGALATMLLLPMPEGARYAAVEVDAGGAVRRIAGGFGPGGEGLTPWHFPGVHVLAPALLARVPAAPFEADVNRHVYPPLMASGAVRGLAAGGYWNDLGTPARYLEASRDVLRGRMPVLPGADPFAGAAELVPGVRVAGGARVELDARVSGPALVLEDAVVEAGAEVGPDAVIGRGCRVPAGAVVRDAVVWDGTVLAPGERVERAIAAGVARVPAGK
jgi:mannose-1-phosphate guanylyltransferase